LPVLSIYNGEDKEFRKRRDTRHALYIVLGAGRPLLLGRGTSAQNPAQTAGVPVAVAPLESSPVSDAPVHQPAVELVDGAAAPSGTFYSDVTFLLWWFKPVCLNVPVVTIGNPSAPVPGAINQPGTQIVVGGTPPHRFDFGATPGGEVTLGWIRADGLLGVEVAGLLDEHLLRQSELHAAPNSTLSSYLPYQAPDGSQQALPFTIPGVVNGSSVAIGSTHVWGVEANVTLPFTLQRGGSSFFGAFLVGGRYLDLTDRDRITNTLQTGRWPVRRGRRPGPVPHPQSIRGPPVGHDAGDGAGKVVARLYDQAGGRDHAPGAQHGGLAVAGHHGPVAAPGAGPLVALPSNIGRETAIASPWFRRSASSSRLAVTSWCSLTLGYTLIYWNKVLCPGDQMDPQVNITQLPFPRAGDRHSRAGPALRSPPDYFAQGLNAGLQFSF